MVTTYDALEVGSSALSPERTITAADLDGMVAVGGYTHPLFTDPTYAASSAFGQRPVPGQGLMLVMGGLAEQSGIFDDTTIGLVAFDVVRFLAPAFAGDTVRLDMEVIAKERDHAGRGVLVFAWLLHRDETLLVEAIARMLFKR
jgi:acyl dehydratase